ncbi:unnamed protein product [Caenorhabditis angaria]|uniref:Uncharacterized protein n=1 Tax=Caenorhabditis angaria TaxID=860376 RepID=A0A9P1IVF8_9PELO|nr:unnamed protein product [Caenorhabditis angaria]
MGSLKSDSVLVWMADRSSYVESTPGTVLRIKNPSKFAENNMGFKDQQGELIELKWESIFKLRPTLIEINHGRNPLKELMNNLEENYESSEISAFFDKVKVLSLHMADISADDLIKLLDKFSLLAAFSFAETRFTSDEWSRILTKLSTLHIRGIDISDNVMEQVAQHLNISLMKLSGNPGVDVKHFRNGIEFVTVTALVVQELFFTGETDAEQFLDVLPTSFPRLQTLIWDWNVVDPELSIDDRTKNIIAKLIDVNQKLNLSTFAIIAYTPSDDHKTAICETARLLTNSKLENVQLYQFASKGLSNGMSNFSLIVAGNNAKKSQRIDRNVYNRSINNSTNGKIAQIMR